MKIDMSNRYMTVNLCNGPIPITVNLPWDKFLLNQFDKFDFNDMKKFILNGTNGVTHTDLKRIKEGKLAGQFWVAVRNR